MTITSSPAGAVSDADPTRPTPTERLLTSSLVFAPLFYLAADARYAVSGWDDATGGLLQVLAAIAYGFVVLRIATWLPTRSRLATAIIFCGLLGLAGNVGFGFDTIHASYGDVQLVDRSGAANIIKPLGLFFPLSFMLVAAALTVLRHRVQAVLVLTAMVVWPVAHIGNIASLAVVSNILLVLGLGSLTRRPNPDNSKAEA